MTDVRSGKFEIWIEQVDGTVRGPHGEQMTREEVDALAHATGICMITISETDALL